MTEINPFGADSALLAELRARELRKHWDDQTMPWPLERLREYLQLSDEIPPGHRDFGRSYDRWQEAPVRIADLRAAFAELDHYKIRMGEARDLAESLYAFLCRGADWPNTLEEFNPDLDHNLLPKWLSGEPDAPDTWERPHATQDALDQEGMDATREYDPDYGKDLDHDDEHESSGEFDDPSDELDVIPIDLYGDSEDNDDGYEPAYGEDA